MASAHSSVPKTSLSLSFTLFVVHVLSIFLSLLPPSLVLSRARFKNSSAAAVSALQRNEKRERENFGSSGKTNQLFGSRERECLPACRSCLALAMALAPEPLNGSLVVCRRRRVAETVAIAAVICPGTSVREERARKSKDSIFTGFRVKRYKIVF